MRGRKSFIDLLRPSAERTLPDVRFDAAFDHTLRPRQDLSPRRAVLISIDIYPLVCVCSIYLYVCMCYIYHRARPPTAASLTLSPSCTEHARGPSSAAALRVPRRPHWPANLLSRVTGYCSPQRRFSVRHSLDAMSPISIGSLACNYQAARRVHDGP